MEIFMSLFFNFFSVSFSNHKSVQWTWSSMGQYMLLFHLLSCKICGVGTAEVDTIKHRTCFPLAQSPVTAGSSFASPDTDCIKDRRLSQLVHSPAQGRQRGRNTALARGVTLSRDGGTWTLCSSAAQQREQQC